MIRLRPEINRVDMPALPEAYQREAVRVLRALGENPRRPEGYEVVELHPSHVALDLSGCFSVRFGGEAWDDSYRLVFRRVDHVDIEIVAIGNRQGSAVFKAAMARLYPPVRRYRRRTHSPADWEGSPGGRPRSSAATGLERPGTVPGPIRRRTA